MRKLLLAVLLAASTIGYAQKVEDVEEKYSKGKYDEAKEKIDKIMAEPKNQNNAKAWYWKGKVYTELARLDSTGSLTYDAGKEAFDAYKKYQQLDPKNILMTLEQNLGLFQLYDLYYNQGIRFYNKKDYTHSFDKMKVAAELEDYISTRGYIYNGFQFPKLDTQLVNLTASAAYLAKKEDEAIPYWEKIADAKVQDKDYRDVYSTLADYYLRKNNPQKADKYLSLGKELFPDNDYWTAIEFGDPGKEHKAELEKLRDDLNAATTDAAKKDLQAKINVLEDKMNTERFAKYETMVQKYPTSYPLTVDYAIEYFNYTYGNEKKPSDYLARQEKTGTMLAKAISLDPNSAIANYVMAQHVYNQIYDLEDAQRAIKGTGAADVAKKKEFTTKINQKYEEIYPYVLKAYELYSTQQTMKGSDKINLRKSIDILIDYHDRKKQADKVSMYQAKLKSL